MTSVVLLSEVHLDHTSFLLLYSVLFLKCIFSKKVAWRAMERLRFPVAAGGVGSEPKGPVLSELGCLLS